MKHLAVHGHKLTHLDKETLLSLPNLESLDSSYSSNLEFNHVKKLFVINSSLLNLKVLSLGFLDNTPVTFDQEFLRNMGERPIEALSLQGLSISRFAFQIMQGLCNSLKTLNLSGSIYLPNTDIDGKGFPLCLKLTTVDVSGTPTRLWAFSLNTYKDRTVKNAAFDLKALPALNATYWDNLFYDIPGFAIRIETGPIYNFSECGNLRNLKEIYFRNNTLQFFNVSCEYRNKFHLELIDLSSNGFVIPIHRETDYPTRHKLK